MSDDPRRRDYRPDWQCQGCGAVLDERPEACPECAHGAFRAVER